MSTQIAFGLVDVTAKSDSTPTTAGKQPFVDMQDLLLDDLEAVKFATCERDLFLLDGSYQPFPDKPQGLLWGLWSLSMSDGAGAFASPLLLHIGFSESHSSMGLTFHFNEDWASEMTVRWYDESGDLITVGLFSPDSADYFADKKVENYRRLEILFSKTSKPYRYLKLTGIDYGLRRIFSGTEVVEASVLEEVDILSSQISINTLDFRLHSNDSDFSILNPKGIFSVLQQNQRLDVRQTISGEKVYMGAYFLDEWENSTENDIMIRAIDWVGVLDKTTFYGGIYSNIPAADLAEEIAGGVPFDMPEDLGDIKVSGHIAIVTRREALQQLAFAIGAVVDCSRSDVIRLYPAPVRPSKRVTYGRKLIGQSLKQKPFVTGVDVTAHSYVEGTEQTDLFSDEVEAGEYEIVFSSPAYGLSITGGTILESNANYARIDVPVSGEAVLTGTEYVDNQRIVKKRMPNLPAGTLQNVLSIEDATLVSPALAGGVAKRVFDYSQLRHENEFTFLLEDEAVSDMVMIDSMNNEKLKGMIESLEINLSGGFLAKIKVSGERIETLAADYTGELYAGDILGVV